MRNKNSSPTIETPIIISSLNLGTPFFLKLKTYRERYGILIE